MPITGVSKKQTSVSKSTPEAEIVALDHGVSKEGMASATLWQHAVGKGKGTQPFIINVLEDNESACRIVITGLSPNMRYTSRTQRIDISWLNERFNDGIFRFVACKVQTFLPRPASTRSYGIEICIPLVCSCRDTCRNIWPNPPNPVLSPLPLLDCPLRMESGAKSGFNRLIERLLSEYEGIVIDEEKGGKRCEKTIVADQALANVFAFSEFCRVITLQVAPGYRNHIVRTGRVEGDSLCYVVLALNDLAPDRVDSRTGKWGQTRKLRDRTESAVRQRFNIACDARTCGCTPVILFRPQCNVLREGEVEGIAAMHGFDCKSVCACQCIFRCFSSKSFVSMWSTCKMRGGDALSPHDRLLAVNFIAA